MIVILALYLYFAIRRSTKSTGVCFQLPFINLLQKEEIAVGFSLLLKTEIAKIEAE